MPLADFPHLVAQLDRKNGALAPDGIATSSRRKLWWRCSAGPDHLWCVPVVNRTTGGAGCPFCAGRAVSVTNALSKVAPALARQWHPTKNGELRPRDVAAGTHRAVWWKCPAGPDHAWSAPVGERATGRRGCPFCSGRRATGARNLAVVHPDLARQWHPTANGELRPEDVLPRSNQVVWWRCPEGHDYEAKPTARAKGDGCPYCSGRRVAPERSVAVLAPALARQWDREKNGALTPGDVTLSSSRRVHWICAKGPDHRWQTTVANRAAAGHGCPFCAGSTLSVTNSLAARSPDLAREWHPKKNGKLRPEQVIAGTGRAAWWRCASGHDWRASIASRAAGAGCPYCANKLASATNSLLACLPDVAREWHPRKNGRLRPKDVVARGNRRVWWRCASGHEWEAIVSSRAAGTGCPFCAGHLATSDRNLAVAAPHLVAEWHPTRNGDRRPEDVTPGSSTKVWWQCARGHEWQATGKARGSRGTGCPYCAGNLVTPETAIAAVAPALAREWHPTKNRPLTPWDVTPGAGVRVWWRCKKGPDHVWDCRVADREDSGCPFCSNKRLSATNTLAVTDPALAAQWDWTRNGDLTADDVTAHSTRSVYWKCPAGPDHAWQAVITTRRQGPACPFCANKRVSVTNSLAARYPRIAAEWHPKKNGALTPHDVTFGATRRVWWRCVSGHEWQISVGGRTHKEAGCRACYLARSRGSAVTTGKRRRSVWLAAYEGAHHGPVRRVKGRA